MGLSVRELRQREGRVKAREHALDQRDAKHQKAVERLERQIASMGHRLRDALETVQRHRREAAKWERLAQMACIEVDPSCECSGCGYARGSNKREGGGSG